MSTEREKTRSDDLRQLTPLHDSFVGVDSDGCMFDTMTVKQREHFHPLIIKHWHLESCAEALVTCADFSSLISKFRGSNRFPALLRTLQWFREYPGVAESGVELPKLDALRAYVNSGVPLGNPTLKAAVEKTNDPELRRVLEWSLEINRDIDQKMRPVPPFREAVATLELLHRKSDVVVISQTPEAALFKEWTLHGLTGKITRIAGQEVGTKAEQIRFAAEGKYDPSRIIMVGDALGDRLSAQEAGALFYPIMPGAEEESWKRFREEAYPLFLEGKYAGEYEDSVISRFEAALPSIPPWTL